MTLSNGNLQVRQGSRLFAEDHLPVRWIELFNGRDLTGWTPVGYDGWRIENGVLVERRPADPVG